MAAIQGRNKMDPRLKSTAHNKSLFFPVVTIATAIGIFVADTVTDSEIIASVFYIAVVLMSDRFFTKRTVIFVTFGCIALTILSYFLTATTFKPTAVINTAISLLTIGLTTYLVLQIESARSIAAALVEADLLRDALIGSVSHELRTPLASILGGASILAEIPTVIKDARLSSLANGIRDEAVQLNNDIQNLLDAARITSQGLHSNRDWTEPADIVNSAVGRVRLRHPSHRFDIDFDGDLPLVHVDPVLVEQALAQIIANAAKYSFPVSVIRITAKVENGQLTITVIDQGVGLTSEEKERLTERFFRGPRHIGTTPGSGLGMWIANTFIVSSGGILQVLSPGEGQGTAVKIAFPISVQNYSDGAAFRQD
jgi:K+-sensing histidine kinase KdpD